MARSRGPRRTRRRSEQHRERAALALDELDFASIGTLHAFAQRILTLHPIEACIPPRVEVLDEVGSSVASDDRWAIIQRKLLDDDDIGDVLVPALAMGIKLDQLRSLARAFNTDWDLIEDRIVGEPPTTGAARRHRVLRRGGRTSRREQLTAWTPTDKLYGFLAAARGHR